MLHLKTAAGERLEIPAGCIIAVMKPCDGLNPAGIMYDMGAGLAIDQLSDTYGFVKKSTLDAGGMINPIEVKVIEAVVGEGGDAASAFREGRMIFARSRIEGRRELVGDPNGIRAALFVKFTGQTVRINVADTLDEMDGVEVDDAPVPAPTSMPVSVEGA